MSSDYDYYSDSDSDTEPNSSKQLTLGEKLRRVGEEEKGFNNDIRKKIQAKLKAKQIDNKDALIAPIHKDIITKYNSVNVIVGKQSLGKTVTALEEIIKIGYMGTHHLLVYITKDGEENDKSWQTLKNMIEMPIVLVAEEDAEDCIDEILTAKSMYYRIRRERTKNEIPEDCKTLIIASPETDFTDYETELIIKYINNGGNILWLSDYTNSGVLSNTKKILDLYGINVSNNGIIIEQDASSMLMQTQDLILPTLSTESEITSAFATSGKVLFIDSGKIEIVDEEKLNELQVTVTELLTTSEKSFYRTDLSNGSSKPNETEEVKSYIVGALATKTINKEEENNVTSKLVIYANNAFATDTPITISQQAANAIYFYNNQDLILNSISYLTERTDSITIRKTHSTVTYAPTESEDLTVKVIIFTFPLIIIVVGIIIWIKRKHRT